MSEPLLVRRLLVIVGVLTTAFALAVPAYADQADVTSARAAFKAAVAAAAKAQKAAILKANRDFQNSIKNAPAKIEVASAQAKALAEQATRVSEAKNRLEQSMVSKDPKARQRAKRDYEMQWRRIQMETEKALKNAKSAGKTTRQQAQMLRDQAIKNAKEIYKAAVAEARAKLNAVLLANGLPLEKR